jgi:hypothetical protein
VASLNPTPQPGKGLTSEEASTVAGILLAKQISATQSTKTGVVTVKTLDTVVNDTVQKTANAEPITSANKFTKSLATQATQVALQTIPITQVQTQTQTQLQTMVQPLVRTLTLTIPTTLGQTEVAEAVQEATMTAVQALTLALTQAASMTRTAVAPAEAVATQEAVLEETAVVPLEIVIPKPGGKGEITLTRKQREGIVAWKQGFMFWLKWPDEHGNYPKKNTHHSRKPIEGVKYEKGIGSVARSIIAKYGRIPKDLAFDMGIENVKISKTPAGGKPKITFTEKHQYKSKHKTKRSGDGHKHTRRETGISRLLSLKW